MICSPMLMRLIISHPSKRWPQWTQIFYSVLCDFQIKFQEITYTLYCWLLWISVMNFILFCSKNWSLYLCDWFEFYMEYFLLIGKKSQSSVVSKNWTYHLNIIKHELSGKDFFEIQLSERYFILRSNFCSHLCSIFLWYLKIKWYNNVIFSRTCLDF